MSFILDASAVLRFLDGEAGTDRVEQILDLHLSRSAQALISAMHWGEITGVFFERHGVNEVEEKLSQLRASELIVVPVTRECAERCAKIKAKHGVPYVDALAVELASDTPDSVLVTADFDMKPAEHFITIEFLPTKQTR